MPTASLSFAETSSGAAVSVTIAYRGEGGVPRVEMTGAQTYPVDLGAIPAAGCKGVLVWVDAKDTAGGIPAAPLTMIWMSNSISKSEELSAGGAMMLASPMPVHGITALSLVSTVNMVAHAVVLG